MLLGTKNVLTNGKNSPQKIITATTLGSFGTNYSIFKNVEMFKTCFFFFFQMTKQTFLKENIESSKIFYLSI
jgi:hypothetical protein